MAALATVIARSGHQSSEVLLRPGQAFTTNAKGMVNDHQEAVWKGLYLFSEMLYVKIDVTWKMEIYCTVLFSHGSTCWKIAINCIYLS